MIKRLLFLFVTILSLSGKAQCPQVYNYLGNLSSNPYWLSCSGSTLYTLNFQSNTSWGTYTINWGDGTPNTVGGSYIANSILNHTYTSAVPDTFVVTLMIPSLNCTLTGVVVMEKPVNASIQIPIGGVTQACAPAVLQFINSSTDVSSTTQFLWDFGDGTPAILMSYTNAGATVTHTYAKGTVNCQTQVNLQAWNYCSQGNTTIATYNPVQIYDVDNAAISVNKLFSCWPDNAFTYSNTTTRNCLAQGNTFQRQEWWNFGNYWGSGDSIVDWQPWPPTSPITIAYPAVGTYTAMLRDSNMCGVDTSIITINIINPPTAGIIAQSGPLCQNASVSFTNSSSPGYVYMWDFGAGGGFVNLGPGNKTFTYSSPGTYTVQLSAFLPGGGSACTSTASTVINILPSPTANFTNNPSFGCTVLNNVIFNESSIGAVSWNWDFGNTVTSTLQAPPNQNYSSVGAYVVSLTVTGTNTCIHTKTASIVVHPDPIADFSPTTTCAGSATSFTNLSTVSGTNAITSYTWDFGDSSPPAFTQNPSHTYTLAGTYSVQLTVSTAFCSGTVIKTITVNIKPTADFAFTPTTGCSPFNVTFTNSSLNANSYLWNFGTVPTNTSNIVNPSFTYTNGLQTNETYTATLFAITNLGCSDSIKKIITVLPVPVTGFTADIVSGCAPLPVNFTNNTIGAATYSWNFGDGNSSTATNPAHTYTNSSLLLQTNTVQLIATNSVNCSSTFTQVVSVFPQPFFSFTMVPVNGCTPLSVNFPPVLGAVSYSWNFGDGSPVSNASNPTHVFTNTTVSNQTYTVTLTASNAFGCIDSTYGFPVVFTKPTADFSATPSSGCPPLLVTFSNTSVDNSVNSWNFGNSLSSTATHPSSSYTSAPGSAAQSYSVKLIVTNANNCSDSIIKTVDLFARPEAGFGLDTPACSPKLITFTNTSTGADSYNWNFGNGEQSTLANPSQTYINTGSSNQNYSVTLIAVNSNSCTDTVIIPFVLHPAAAFNISSSPDSGCTPLNVFFPNLPGAVQYQWNFGDGNSSSSGGVNNIYVNAGTTNKTFTVQLIAKDEYNCSDTSGKIITIFPKPTALFQADPLTVFVPNQSTQFFNLSSNAASYFWKFGDGATSMQVSPTHAYANPGEYVVTLIATSNKGCKDTFDLPEKIIALEESLVEVPNAFTPNTNGSPGIVFDPKDTSNDIFHPNMRGVDKYNMSIYSRWGELLFETKNPAEGWDGYYKGKLCTQDVYVWKITAIFLDGKKFDKTGDLLLLR